MRVANYRHGRARPGHPRVAAFRTPPSQTHCRDSYRSTQPAYPEIPKRHCTVGWDALRIPPVQPPPPHHAKPCQTKCKYSPGNRLGNRKSDGVEGSIGGAG